MPTLPELETRQPEWRPWLTVVRSLLPELDETRWDAGVGRVAAGTREVPLLAKAASRPDEHALAALLQKLTRAAVRSEMPGFRNWNDRLCSGRGALAVFRAALDADAVKLAALAAEAETDSEPFAAVAALLPMPFLHACRRAWTQHFPADWSERYCLCCGAWPVLVEVCGIERSRYLRCIRCAASWQSPCLRCPYCGMSEHERLGSLLVERGKESEALEVCNACKGYIKVFNRLRPTSPGEIMLNDLASVDLDLAAGMRGYRRPEGVGFRLEGAFQP